MRRLALLTVAVVTAGSIWVVAPAAAGPVRQQRADIRILENADFTKANGVRAGKGTEADPYVISGWELGTVVIENTSRWVTIRDNTINGQLVLDWIGRGANVHHNRINDLRVNQNRMRTGLPTSGSIARNTFVVVGQLRHWDGIFEKNIVGRPEDGTARFSPQAVNFDGFNGARFRYNTIYGHMVARLHGHHHSSSFSGSSHMHAGEHDGGSLVDHRQRYHRVSITDNTIRSAGDFALAYVDTGHAGNDRTAPSEQNKELNNPHVHHTRVFIARNKLLGSGLLVDVFNAEDQQKHPRYVVGSLTLSQNRIDLGRDDVFSLHQLQGIEVRNARYVHLHIAGNAIKGVPAEEGGFSFLEDWDSDAGIFLHDVTDADVMIEGNRVENRVFGVHALRFTESVDWSISKLATSGVRDAVYYDESVANAPKS